MNTDSPAKWWIGHQNCVRQSDLREGDERDESAHFVRRTRTGVICRYQNPYAAATRPNDSHQNRSFHPSSSYDWALKFSPRHKTKHNENRIKAMRSLSVDDRLFELQGDTDQLSLPSTPPTGPKLSWLSRDRIRRLSTKSVGRNNRSKLPHSPSAHDYEVNTPTELFGVSVSISQSSQTEYITAHELNSTASAASMKKEKKGKDKRIKPEKPISPLRSGFRGAYDLFRRRGSRDIGADTKRPFPFHRCHSVDDPTALIIRTNRMDTPPVTRPPADVSSTRTKLEKMSVHISRIASRECISLDRFEYAAEDAESNLYESLDEYAHLRSPEREQEEACMDLIQTPPSATKSTRPLPMYVPTDSCDVQSEYIQFRRRVRRCNPSRLKRHRTSTQ